LIDFSFTAFISALPPPLTPRFFPIRSSCWMVRLRAGVGGSAQGSTFLMYTLRALQKSSERAAW
jgi:hypothetical protein